MGIQPNSGIDRGGNSFAGGLWALWKQASSLVRAGWRVSPLRWRRKEKVRLRMIGVRGKQPVS
jgi:hypothetical protein